MPSTSFVYLLDTSVAYAEGLVIVVVCVRESVGHTLLKLRLHVLGEGFLIAIDASLNGAPRAP